MRETLDDYLEKIDISDTSFFVAKDSDWGGFSILALLGKGFYVDEINDTEKAIYSPKGDLCGSIKMIIRLGRDVLNLRAVSDAKLLPEIKIISTPETDNYVKNQFPKYKKLTKKQN